MKKIQINNFDLIYNGMYFIKWNGCRIRVYLELNVILKMIEIEGLNFDIIDQKMNHSEPILFNRIVMEVKGIVGSAKRALQTHDLAAHYDDQRGFVLVDIGHKTIDSMME